MFRFIFNFIDYNIDVGIEQIINISNRHVWTPAFLVCKMESFQKWNIFFGSYHKYTTLLLIFIYALTNEFDIIIGFFHTYLKDFLLLLIISFYCFTMTLLWTWLCLISWLHSVQHTTPLTHSNNLPSMKVSSVEYPIHMFNKSLGYNIRIPLSKFILRIILPLLYFLIQIYLFFKLTHRPIHYLVQILTASTYVSSAIIIGILWSGWCIVIISTIYFVIVFF